MSKPPEWTEYAVGAPSTRPNWTNPGCVPLEEVYHIAHVSDAMRIFEDGVIRSSLVWDESRLKTKRTQVSWVSPNDWCQGSIYGSVCFTLDWKELVEDRLIYWVEKRTTPGQRIVRFLLSDGEFCDEALPIYDPTKGDGPLCHDSSADHWVWNNRGLTHEYMVVADLRFASWATVSFVRHHDQWCSRSGRNCTERTVSRIDSGARVLARLLALDMRRYARLFASEQGGNQLEGSVRLSLRLLRRRFASWCTRSVSRRLPSDRCEASVRSILLFESLGKRERAKALANSFPNPESLTRAFDACVQCFFRGFEVELE